MTRKNCPLRELNKACWCARNICTSFVDGKEEEKKSSVVWSVIRGREKDMCIMPTSLVDHPRALDSLFRNIWTSLVINTHSVEYCCSVARQRKRNIFNSEVLLVFARSLTLVLVLDVFPFHIGPPSFISFSTRDNKRIRTHYPPNIRILWAHPSLCSIFFFFPFISHSYRAL